MTTAFGRAAACFPPALVWFTLAACTNAATVQGEGPLDAIPAAYHGNWSIDPAYCNFEGDTLDNELFIDASNVGFHAETHRVRTVRRTSKGVAVRYHPLADATREPPAELRLSGDGVLLNDTWYRCPDPQP